MAKACGEKKKLGPMNTTLRFAMHFSGTASKQIFSSAISSPFSPFSRIAGDFAVPRVHALRLQDVRPRRRGALWKEGVVIRPRGRQPRRGPRVREGAREGRVEREVPGDVSVRRPRGKSKKEVRLQVATIQLQYTCACIKCIKSNPHPSFFTPVSWRFERFLRIKGLQTLCNTFFPSSDRPPITGAPATAHCQTWTGERRSATPAPS